MIQWLFSRKRKTVSVPSGVRVYAVGDIHGRLDLLSTLQELMATDSRDHSGENIIVYLGDYIDRGADSHGVLERLLRAPERNFSARFIRGNHDQLLLDFLEDPSCYRLWRNYGAQETLLSYGVRPPLFDDEGSFATTRDELSAALPRAHLDFLKSLKLSEEIGDYFFVHAGVRPGIPLASQSPEDLLGIRQDFLTATTDFGKVIVHGHTPTRNPERHANRIAVDTGAYATGRLSCVVLEGEDCRFLHT